MKTCCSAAVIALLGLIGGCSALPSYQLKISTPHKDVLHLTIYLPDRVEPVVYQRIALRELERMNGWESAAGLPLYEVEFEFRRSDPERERLARVVVRQDDPPRDLPQELARATFLKIETTLY